MSQKHKKRKHAKSRKRRGGLRILKLIGNTVLGGITLGLSASLIILLLPKVLPFVNTFINKPRDNTATVYDYTTITRANATPLAGKGGGKATPDSLRVLEDKEVEEKLAELARENEDIAAIYAERSKYPEELLAALAANQEMIDFVKGYLASDGSVTGGINGEEKAQDFPLFLQWDKRWGYAPYGRSAISISGCGPTCLSMVVFSLTRDESATPDALARFAMDNGYYMEGQGTLWSYMTEGAAHYGIHAREIGLDEDAMKQYLDRGCPIVCAMRPGDFTTTGHFIMIYGYDENGFMVNDPNSLARSGRQWDFETIRYQINNLWGFSAA